MTLSVYHVDAFTNRVFAGNPAAVMVLPKVMDKVWMQQVAAEHNLSETAFLVADGKGWQLRWFTPGTEVDLCGHATLASAHVLFEQGLASGDKVEFYTASGTLTVTRNDARDGSFTGNSYTLDFPARLAEPAQLPAAIAERLGFVPLAVEHINGHWLVATSEAQVREFDRSFTDISAGQGIILTAEGSGQYDLVSRYFAFHGIGLDEDPVTGSAHCQLVPFWAKRTGKTQFKAYQASSRGGELLCELNGERVLLTGQAVTYSQAQLVYEEGTC